MGMDLAAQQMNNTGTAGVIARPPLLFLAALLLGFVLDHLLSLPLPDPRTDFHRITAGFMILIGVVVFVAGIRNFSSAATPVQGNVERLSRKGVRLHSMADWPRLTAHVSRCSPSPNPPTLSKVSHDRSFLDLGGYLLEDYPRLLDAERPDHDRRNQRARKQQPQEPTQMVWAPRIEWAEQRYPASSAEMS